MSISASPRPQFNRRNLILLALVLLQLVLIAAVFWSRSRPLGQELQPLLTLTLEDIERIQIADTDSSLSLAKKGDGWVLPEAGDFPADSSRIEGFLANLVALDNQTLIATNPSSYERLQVADDTFVRRVVLQAGNSSQELLIGSSPSTGLTHVRTSNQNGVYVSRKLRSSDARVEASGWIDTSFVSENQSDIVALRLENISATLDLSQDATGNWRIVEQEDNETIDQTVLNTLLRQASSLRMVAPLGNEVLEGYGLDQPLARVTVETERVIEAEAEGTEGTEAEPQIERNSYEIIVGSEQEGGYVVQYSTSPYIVLVTASSVSALLELERDTLVNVEETVVPEPVAANPALPIISDGILDVPALLQQAINRLETGSDSSSEE